MTIRLANDADVNQIPITLARAFLNDPWIAWTVDANERYRRLVELYTLYVVNFGRSIGGVWVSDDCAAVASWFPPGHDGPDGRFEERHGERLVELMGDRAGAAMAAGALQAKYRPQEPHWYLASMATHPDWQGRGLGSRVLEPALARCDRDGVPALTDTSTEINVRFYTKQGFDVVGEDSVGDGGPHVWFLRREPRG
ncbi:GNAT family N-acetyltransferase [Actinomadura sp. KC216]|uniref:GNAT family N-acetyltransferase n=1 Tax=Actinomadura sp. KC216 TaxID=2530370 RepID=UPI001051869B|nr:GNAT family N-acetyltransferase [Actinomadura sp. KC216]TDB83794.1 GNAT family N-acetyltransferase [Actinomadura sp. KC216]